MNDFKTLIGVAFDIKQAQSELDRQIKLLQKNSKLALNIELSDKEAKKAINDSSKMWSNYRKEAVAAMTAPNTELQKMSQYYKNLEKDIQSNIASQKKLFVAEEQAYKINQKMSDSMGIVKNRAEGASKGFGTYLKTLKPQALKDYSVRINEISNAFSNAAKSGKQIDLTKANSQLSNFKSTMKEAGMETASFTQIIKDNIGAFTNWYLIGGAVSSLVGDFKSAINTIKEVDTLLTEISKTSNLSGNALKELGINAFDAASKYGNTVQSYLKGFQEMSRGTDVETATGLTELSIKAQSAGDMTAELANDYIIATNAAYQLNNEVTKLNAILDGQNQITNRNQVSMTELAEATKIAGSQAAQSGIDVDKMTAAVGTMIASTKQGGEVAGRAFKGILMNLQQVSGEIDGEVFDEKSFKKVEGTLNDVGVATEVIVDGVARLRDPIETLKELAKVYNSLPKDSVDRANIIADLGGKYRGNQLAALLSNWDTYEKMLSDYQNSSGSAAEEAMKTADSIEGRLNKLTNTWNEAVANVVNSDMLKTFISIGTGAIDLADKMDILQNALIGIGGFGAYKGLTSLIPMLSNAISSTIAFGNALNSVKASDFVANSSNLSNILSGLSSKQMVAVLSTKALSTELKSMSASQLTATLTNAGLSEAEAKTIASTIALSTATGTATTTTLGFGASLKALGAAMMANPIGLAITALTVGISALSFATNKYKQSQEEMLSKAKESTSAFNDQTKTINDYTSQIKSLRKTIESSNSSTEAQQSAKEQLLSVQGELINSYGLEKNGLDLVNGSINEQISKLQTLTKEKAQAYLNENKGAIDKATNEMTRERRYNLSYSIVTNTDEGQAIKSIAEQFKDQGIKIMPTADGGEYYIHFYGDASQAENTINDFMTDVSNLKGQYKDSQILNDVLGISSDELNEAKSILDQYQDLYETALTAQLVTMTPQKGLDPSKTFYEYTQAVEKYNEALASGDGIGEAAANYNKLNKAVTDVLKEFPQFKPIFDDIKNQAIESSNSVNNAIKGMGDSSKETSNEILSIEDALSALTSTGKTIADLKDEIKEVGSISASTVSSLMKSYPSLTESLSLYLAGKVSEKQILSELSQLYVIDEQNYRNATLEKFKTSESFYSNIGMTNTKTINSFNKNYGVDLNNVKSYAQAKLAIENQLLNTLKFNWSQYYNAQLDAFSEDYAKLGMSAGQGNKESLAKIKQLEAGVKGYRSAIKGLNNISYKGINVSNINYDKSGNKNKNKKSTQVKDKKSTQEIDWINRKLEVLKANYDIIKKRASEILQLHGGQNKELDKAIKKLKSQISIQKQAYKSYMKQANSVGLSNSLKKLVQNGSMKISEYSDSTAKKIEEYQKWYDEAQKVKQTITDLKLEEKELAKQRIDNVVDDYDRKKSLQDALISKKESQIAYKESKGGSATESDYNYLIERQNNVKTNLQKEYDKIKTEFNDLLADGTIKKYSDDWYDYKEILVGIETELVGCDEEVENLKNSIEELRWKSFEDAIDKIGKIKDEINDVQGLLSGSNFDEDGDLTDTGLTNLALNFQGINQSKQAIADYDLAIRSLDKSQADYNEKLAEYQSAQRQAANDIKAYRDAIIDFKKNAIEAETEAMRENVQAKKDELQAEKDLHDYRNSIADKEQDINTLNKKIEALQLSTDRKDIAMRLSLEQERAEAEKDLSETQYNHNIETQQNALDEELSSYEELQNDKISELENSTDKQEQVIRSYLKDVTNNYDSVYQNINTLADDYGLSLTDSLTSPWESAQSAAQVYYDFINEMGADVSINPSKNSKVSSLIGEQGSHNTEYSKDSGASDLNKYLASKGYKTFSYDEAGIVQLAKALGVSGISKESDVDNSKTGKANKDRILAALKAAGFSGGGFIDARSVGEDGYALVKHGEAILKVDESNALKEIAPVFPLLNNLVKAYTPNFSSIDSKSSSTPLVINSPLVTITGVTRDEINSETQRQIQQIPKEIMKTLGQHGVR